MAVKTEEPKKETKEESKSEGKKVTIRLFKDSGKYKNDVLVGVNGKFWQIQRGVDVEVPDYVAEIIRQSIEQDNRTADLIAMESSTAKSAEALL